MILPMCCDDSISACAFGGLGEREDAMDDRLELAALEQRPHLALQRRASAALRSTGLARSVEPVTVRRFIMIWRQSHSTRLPLQERDDAPAGLRAPGT